MKRIYKSPPQNDQLEADERIDKLTASRLGFFRTDKKSSFVNFQTKKPEGVMRVGCFGDSFTYGDEVSNVNDYPSLLQAIFIQNGYNNVQVINFGCTWYGFSQAFIMWKYVGRKYDLDYILLGPACFQFFERDYTFNHTGGIDMYYLHARYVLKGDALELIDVIGDTYKQRMRNYYKFMPRLRYLRFDAESPFFLKCLIPEGRWLKNPFYYYKGSMGEEVSKIQTLLLSEMADNGTPVILNHGAQNIINMGNEIAKNKKNLLVSHYVAPNDGFPYVAPCCHNSPMGSYIVAQQMFDCIKAKNNTELVLLKTEDIDDNVPQQPEIERLKLYEYTKVAVEINDVKLGCFVRFKDMLFNEPIDKIPHTSLIVIGNKNTSILDGCFLPLDFELRDDMALTMRVVTGLDAKEYNIGTLKLLNQRLNIGRIVNSHKIFFSSKPGKLILKDTDIKHGAEVTLLLDNNPILFGKNTKKTLELNSIKHGFIVLRANGDDFIDVKKIGESGIVYLSLLKPDGKEIKIPFAKWSKEINNVLRRF